VIDGLKPLKVEHHIISLSENCTYVAFLYSVKVSRIITKFLFSFMTSCVFMNRLAVERLD